MLRRMHRNPTASVDVDAPLDTVWAVMTDTGLLARAITVLEAPYDDGGS